MRTQFSRSATVSEKKRGPAATRKPSGSPSAAAAAAAAAAATAADAVSPRAVQDFIVWRSMDVTAKVLSHQPLEPARAIASRLYNDRCLVLAVAPLTTTVAGVAPSAGPQAKKDAAAPIGKHGPKSSTTAAAASAASAVACSNSSGSGGAEGLPFRQWTSTRLMPYGLEALNTYQLPALAFATSEPTATMLATVVALAHRQGRATAGDRRAVPPPVTPLFYAAAEEVEVALAVPLVLALAEQQARGLGPGLTARAALGCAAIALRVLGLESRRERAAAAASSAPCTPRGEAGAGVAVAPLLSSRLARVGTAAEVTHLCAHLCKCVNRGLHTAARRGGRSGKSSLSSSMRATPVAMTPDRNRRSPSLAEGAVSCGGGGRGASCASAVPPLANSDLDALLDPLFLRHDESGTTACRAPTVSAAALHTALAALTAALWALHEVAIPLAVLLSSRRGGGGGTAAAAAVSDVAPAMTAALARVLKSDGPCGEALDRSGLEPAEAMLAEDMAAVLTAAAAAGGGQGRPTLRWVAGEAAAVQRAGSPPAAAAAAVWTQSLNWALQLTESVLVAEYEGSFA